MKNKRSFKEKFLYNSFFNYFRAFNACPIDRNRFSIGEVIGEVIAAVFSFVIVYVAIMFFGGASIESEITIISVPVGFGILLYISSLMFGAFRRITPSIHKLAPINYKKRIVYSYLINVIAVILGLLLIVAIGLVIGCLASLIEGKWVFIIESENEILTDEIGVQSILFQVFTMILLFGASTGISFISNKKWRIAAMFIFPIAFLLIVVWMYKLMPENYTIVENFEKLPASIAWITVFGILSVAVFALSVFFAVKDEKPKNF